MYPNITPEDLEELQKLKFNEEELIELNRFLGEFERKTPRLYLVRLFVRAKLAKTPFFMVMANCVQMLKSVWQQGTPGRIGDPDDVHGWGMKNTGAFFALYKILGLPSPKGLY